MLRRLAVMVWIVVTVLWLIAGIFSIQAAIRNDEERKAVAHGAAHYVIRANGDVEFEWNK